MTRRAVLVLGAGSLLLGAVITSHAWVGEDALITFRTIGNWFDGQGLRWNTDERVQTFTHPLWMLINAGLYGLTREIYWTTTLLGLGCALGAFWLTAWPLRERPLLLCGLLLAPWLLSPSLVRYSTSGFENPLTLLLLAVFARALLDWRPEQSPPWLALGASAGLAATNRLDTLLLYLPALLASGVGQRARLRPLRLGLGFAPLIAWLLFSLVYYGFPLPNTALAKLSSEIPARVYLRQGGLYALDLFQTDLAACLLLLAGLTLTAQALTRCAVGRGRLLDRKLAALGLGALLYEGYVLRIGGSFLSGRYWVAPAFLSLVMLSARAEALGERWAKLSLGQGLALAGLAAAAVLGLQRLGDASRAWTPPSQIIPRSLAHAFLGRDARWHTTEWAERFRALGLEARQQARSGRRVSVQTAVGFAGVAAGPEVRIVDLLAITDPLLARLPPAAGAPFHVGHLRRDLPTGYLEARETGSLAEMDPVLRAYYGKLRLVTSGPLFSSERWLAIADLNLGRDDDLLREYARSR